MTTYNYKHLYYFWVVAKEGGMSRAAERLGMAVQTISTQVRELERSLGHQLLKPSGRNVVLTHAGETAFAQAEQIFQLGEKLPDVLTAATAAPKVALRVGISDGLPKLAIPRLLGPALGAENLRLECHEDEFEDLLADLALHRLDLILADRPAPPNGNVRVYSHALGSSPLQWFGHAKWAQPWAAAALADQPAQALATLPLLLPTTHSAVRNRLNQWMDKQHIQPNVVGEFEDSALLATFAATGMGLFPAPELVRDELTQRLGFVWLGACEGVTEQFYLIGSERKVMHPLVKQVLEAGVVI
jgi:LysR family transcriptional regulator, transcriptional activator of nhaA